jgi:UDP-N-acetyl-D-mannosaminuronic acid dehydrogenase
MSIDNTLIISVIGLGYIGLPTSIILAENIEGIVYGFDTNQTHLTNIENGKVNSNEPDLKNRLGNVIKSKRLITTSTLKKSDVFIICVPTPVLANRAIDTRYIEVAVSYISNVIEKNNLIILESTVSPGTTKSIVGNLIQSSTSLIAGHDFSLAYSAERVIPGSIFSELVNNVRIIGGIDSLSSKRAKEVYSLFCKSNIEVTSLETAEITKLFENTYRDVNIALANSFLRLSQKKGIDVWEAIQLANFHPRVNILNPGIGVGGHCIAVDPWFLYDSTEKVEIIGSSRDLNDSMIKVFLDYVNDIQLNNGLSKSATILGLSYKPDIEDIRESPSIRLIDLMTSNGWSLTLSDPFVATNTIIGEVISTEKALQNISSLLIITVGHSYYKSFEFINLVTNLNKPLIIIQTGLFIDINNEMIEVYTFGKN